MTVVELQDIANDVMVTYSHREWRFSASVRGCTGITLVADPDFLVAATRLIIEAKRMREAAR